MIQLNVVKTTCTFFEIDVAKYKQNSRSLDHKI